MTYQLINGDCLEELQCIETGSIDAIFSDPPYPYIKRDYGYWTEAEWMPMMQEVVRQSRRILKPHGSAVFVLQPNSEKVGKMRAWLWKFMAWCCEEWNIIQDSYWWNSCAAPTVHTHRDNGLMRPSLKYHIWLGISDCFRNQDRVLLPVTARAIKGQFSSNDLIHQPSGFTWREGRARRTAVERGGSTPFNVLAMGNGTSRDLVSRDGHGAGTPLKLSDWWLRYIANPGGVVLDPFSGTGTTGVAARRLGLDYIGIERIEKYHLVAEHRLATALDDKPKPAKKPVEDLPMFAGVTI